MQSLQSRHTSQYKVTQQSFEANLETIPLIGSKNHVMINWIYTYINVIRNIPRKTNHEY